VADLVEVKFLFRVMSLLQDGDDSCHVAGPVHEVLAWEWEQERVEVTCVNELAVHD
jgi:hypothetical protein